jgi:energy-coupling factor transport system substrate-specific component
MKNKLEAKDLINVGIYTAIYFVLCMGVAMLGYIPVFIPMLTALCPLIGGIPFMLMLTKTKKPGMVFLMAILCGVLMGIMGMGIWAIPSSIIFGLLAERILKAGHYKSLKYDILAHGVFSMWLIGNFIPMFINRQQYYNALIPGYGEEYANALMSYIPTWSLFFLLVSCFVFGILGGFIGKKLLKKHFVKAGIA